MSATVVETTKGFDVVLVAHVLLAIGSLVVVLVLRAAAASVARGTPSLAAARTFTGRREVAGRLVHLVPLSGAALVALSRGVYSMASGFVVVGLAGWLAMAVALEAFALPAQREVSRAIATEADPTAPAARMVRMLEVVAALLVGVALVMVVWPAA